MAITNDQKNRYWHFRGLGYSVVKASVKAGFSRATGERLERAAKLLEERPPTTTNLREAKEHDQLPGPIPLSHLSDEAARGLEDFAYFQRRYFGRIALPWQVEAAKTVQALLETEEKEYAVINAPPGSGKTVLFTHDIPAWMTCRDRSIRGLMGSATMSLAVRTLGRLKRTFERVYPEKADERDLSLGLALDAEATLAEDYGRFKPLDKELWAREAFIVNQHGGGSITEKEPTWSAYGADTAFIGGRYPFVIWDDLVDPRKLRSVEQREALQDMWTDVGETRLEPGGLLVLQGQRISSDDLYRFALDMRAHVEEDEDGLEVSDELPEDGDRTGMKYHHIVFKAHYDDRCAPEHHKKDSKPWPEGCLLSPRRLPWRELDAMMKNRGERFTVLYQQEDIDPAEVLVPKEWVYGSRDFPGCLDQERDRLELPHGLDSRDCVSIATADPSPTMFWSIQWWVYHPESELRFLVDHIRRKMDAPDFLDWRVVEQSFAGVMDEWQQNSVTLGFPISHWIVEANAAQRFLLQYDYVKKWVAKNGVDLIPHTTSRNKSDADFGVQSIAPHYRYGRVRLPMKGDGRPLSLRLIDEVTKYPYGRTDDCVMAEWFFEWQLPNVYRPRRPRTPPKRPSWLKRSAA